MSTTIDTNLLGSIAGSEAVAARAAHGERPTRFHRLGLLLAASAIATGLAALFALWVMFVWNAMLGELVRTVDYNDVVRVTVVCLAVWFPLWLVGLWWKRA